ncbi:chalcone isomerase family protein [Gallaecimonas mangrovi]|uniref:chalcone isomerase family protein n=1 Tax=Gallaecimonas mangrovi TaxID=2291597 RepID=UPI000E205727|nr:chalcone isomerase family protein [Gallaecimonas mangrovi]
MKKLWVLLLIALPAVGQWQLKGEGRFEYLFWDIYDARYFTDGSSQALSLTYLRNIDAQDIVEQTGKEWRHLGLYQQPWVDWFKRYCPNVKKGDVLRMDVSPKQTRFLLNGQLLATNTDPQFGPAFLAIWLSDKTRAPALRQKLLGKEE